MGKLLVWALINVIVLVVVEGIVISHAYQPKGDVEAEEIQE
jgi:hypothetical protein